MLALSGPVSGHAAPTVLVLGDSLSAGYGIRPEAAWPSLLQSRLVTLGKDYSVANASISGETTAGGLSRLPQLLKSRKPAVIVIELGANDGLRGLPISIMKSNLSTMIRQSQATGAKVLLVGMALPPNYGPYAQAFVQAYQEVAQQTKTPLVDFLFAAIAQQPRYFQADGLHPTAEAQPLLLDTVWPKLLPLLP